MRKRRVIHISTKMIHLNATIISRGGEKPQSAVASAAYRSGTKIYCEYDGEIKDFSRKGHVMYSEILLPEYAPKEFADRFVLWNAVENFEKGSRAQLSREIEFSLPCELDADERLKAAKTLAEFFRDKGMVVDMNLHSPDHKNPNPHCHLMLTMRPFEKDGSFVKKKCWREYDLDKNGQKIPTPKGDDYKSHKVYATDWDDKGNVEKWRALWADIETGFYKKNGYEITAEHRSFERQGIDLLPTIHMGAAVTAMERRGIQTEVGNMNREIKKINALIISSMENVERLTDKIAFLEKEKKAIEQDEEKETQTQESKPDTLISILMEWQKNRSAFIQDNNIRQRMDTKTGNIKDFSAMVAFLQSHKIETLEDLLKMVEDTKKRRSGSIHNQRELNAKRKKMSNIVDIYQAYKPYAEYLKKYESLSGRQKQSYYDKNADKIETALSYRTGLKNMSGTDKLLPKTWKKELDGLKAESAKITHDLAKDDAILGELAEIADKVAMVQRAKAKQNEILPNLGEEKRIKKERGSYGRE
ncbi:MAG: MobA/MobL family protein [Lachnospiraceae bacterium]